MPHPHRSLRGEKPPAHNPFPWELSPLKSPSIFKVTCQSPRPGGFLAQVSQPGAKAQPLPAPRPLGLLGPKAFGGSRHPRPSHVLGPRREGHPPWEEARGLARAVAWAGLVPGAGWGRRLPPQLPLLAVCLFFGPIALCPRRASFKQKSCSCSLCPHPVPQEISYHCCICNLWIRGLSIYYYWLIIIIDYVNLPPVCLSRVGFLGDPGCGGCTGPPLHTSTRYAVQETVVWGHWLGPRSLAASPTARPPLPHPFSKAGAAHGLCSGGRCGGSCS